MDDRAVDLKGIDRTSLIDVTSVDDLLVSDPSSRENYIVTVGSEGTGAECSNMCCVDNGEAPAPHRPKKGASEKFNLRKSLAWDNAFFTSEGVLNSEELAIVNSTFRKVESHVLPAIQEDMRRSCESSTTIDDECLTVESIEMELFGNLRASIQKAYDKCDTIPTIEQPGNTTGSRKVEFQGSKKTGIPSHVGKKPPMVLKRDAVHKLRQNEASKELSSSQDAASGKGNPIKQQRTVPSVATGPAKKSSIPQLTQVKKSTQKDSDTNHSGRTSTFAREVPATLTRKTIHGSSGSTIPPGGSMAVSSTSYMRPGRMSDQTRKDPLNPPREKVDSKNSAKNTFSAGLRSPLVSEIKNATANAKIRNAFLKFSTASPSSSLESIESSCSSSSTATTGINSSSNFGSDNTAYQPIGQKFGRCRPSDKRNDSSAGPSSLYSHPTSGVNSLKISRTSGQPASVNRSSETKPSKPSGLRMPRPKIGYFDAAKSMTGNLSTSQVESQCPTPRTTSRLEGSSGALKSELSGTVLESINTQSQLESVLQSATSSTMTSLSTAKVSASTKALDDQNIMKNVRGENSQITEGIDSDTNKSTKPACQVGSEISNAVGDNPHTNSDMKCTRQSHPIGVLAKAGELKMHDINNSVEENLKDTRISWKASVNSEKPSSILSPNVTKTMPSQQESLYSHLADNTGKENLLHLESQMN